MTLTPGGQQGRGYVILVTVERDGNAGEGGIRETRIQIGTSSTGFTAASGLASGARVVERDGLVGADPTLLWREWVDDPGTYYVTAQLRNVAAGAGDQLSDWSTPVSVVTTAQASGNGYAQVVEVRLDRSDGRTELVVVRPESNWETVYTVEVQVFRGRGFPRTRGTLAAIRSPGGRLDRSWSDRAGRTHGRSYRRPVRPGRSGGKSAVRLLRRQRSDGRGPQPACGRGQLFDGQLPDGDRGELRGAPGSLESPDRSRANGPVGTGRPLAVQA